MLNLIRLGLVLPIHNRKNITINSLNNIHSAIRYYERNGLKNLIIDIIVVDDGSIDGSGDWIKSNRPEVILINGDGHQWWSGSINMGAKYAVRNLNCSHVLLWNDDTICKEDYFCQLELVVLSNAIYQTSILVSKIFWLNESNNLFNFGCLYSKMTGKKTLIGLNQKDIFKEIKKIDWSGGMGTLIPANILEEVNYFDNINFPQYHGDIDFFLRAKEKGHSAYSIPNLTIYNDKETTGMNVAKSMKDLKLMLFSNRSIYNFKQNFYFNRRHSNTLISWFNLFNEYILLILKSIRYLTKQ
ncbi:glycosyltransferase [Pelobium sp.]|nr:glycosyltransferase [Pelobium sp.]MDA9555551.1 glycosyltransferase [Pelobium sp.]